MLCSYANSESYRRALEDFDAALAVNPDHANAQKYACDTLLALARRWVGYAAVYFKCIKCKNLSELLTEIAANCERCYLIC